MAEPSKPDALADEILSEARRQADRKLDRARKRADRILRTARRRSEELEQQALEAVAGDLDRETAAVLADLPHEEKMRTLRVQSEVIDGQFESALRTLQSMGPEDMVPVLARLGADAIGALDGDRFVVEVRPDVADRMASALTDALAAELGRRGRQAHVTLEASAALAEGGVIVRSDDGREAVDHAFPTRLRRLRRELRNRVAEIIFGEAGS